MSKPLNLSRLQRCEQDIVRHGFRKPGTTFTITQILDYLLWVRRFHPELRERVDDDIADLYEVQQGLRDGTDPWSYGV